MTAQVKPRGRPARRSVPFVPPPAHLAEHRTDASPGEPERLWAKWCALANRHDQRQGHAVTRVRCRECGEMIGTVFNLDGLIVIGVLVDGVYCDFVLIAATKSTKALPTARLASIACQHLTCPQGHERPLAALRAIPVQHLADRANWRI